MYCITRELEIEYLRIDSLCIIQDDVQDWEVESAIMADVYSKSYLTIAATGVPKSFHGCLFRRYHDMLQRIKVPRNIAEFHNWRLKKPFGVEVRYSAKSHREFAGDHVDKMECAPLLTRVWASQERLLSTRTIHFHGEEIV
jgi:hypothetical protein